MPCAEHRHDHRLVNVSELVGGDVDDEPFVLDPGMGAPAS
jgi:hypothetical protein